MGSEKITTDCFRDGVLGETMNNWEALEEIYITRVDWAWFVGPTPGVGEGLRDWGITCRFGGKRQGRRVQHHAYGESERVAFKERGYGT